MKLIRLAVTAAVATLPPPLRERYREEWLADLEGAVENGVKPVAVAVGAMMFSITLGRNAPEVSGMPIAVAVRRRARWGIAFISAAAVLSFGYYFLGGYAFGETSSGVLATLGRLAILAVASAFLLLGLIQLWRAALAASTLLIVATALVTAGIVCSAVGVLVPSLAMSAVWGLLFLCAGGVCGAVASASALPVSAPAPRTSASWRPGRMVAIATFLLTTLIALGAVELLVWGPLAHVDGYRLSEIYAALSPFDRAYGVALIVIWIVFWMLAAAAFAIVMPVVVRRSKMTARSVLAIAFGFAAAIVFFHWWAGFSLSMNIGDALSQHSSAMSPMAQLYAIVGQLSLVTAIFLSIAPRRMRMPGPAVAI